jgi:hypothetical protein
MSNQFVRKVGVDPGFGGVKVAEVRLLPVDNGVFEREMITRHLPSVIGVGSTDAGGLGLAGVVRGRKGEKPDVVEFDGMAYLVGANVAEYARPIERMDFQRFSEGPELRALLYAGLYQLLDGGGHTCALAIGLPVELLQDADQAQVTERAMAGWLVGKHHFAVNGVEAVFWVKAIKAKIAQPVATWFDWGLGLDGQWALGDKAMRAPALVVDEGFNTLDVVAIEGGKISTRYSSGTTLGMRRAAEMTAGNVERRHGVELSLHEADALVQKVLAGARAQVYVVGELTDVSAEVRQAVNALAADVIRFVEREVGKAKKFRVLITGGGALALADRMLAQWGHAEVMADPQLANARGLAKLAARKGFLE